MFFLNHEYKEIRAFPIIKKKKLNEFVGGFT